MTTIPPAGARQPWLIAVTGSAGSLEPMRALLQQLPPELPASILILMHRPPFGETRLPAILRRCTRLPVVMADEGERLIPGVVYIARADQHLRVSDDRRFRYHDGALIKFFRASANPMLESAAHAFDGHLVAVVLSGGGSDATDGVQSVKAHGGLVIAQAAAQHSSMPESAQRAGAVDYVLPSGAIAPVITAVITGTPMPVAPWSGS